MFVTEPLAPGASLGMTALAATDLTYSETDLTYATTIRAARPRNRTHGGSTQDLLRPPLAQGAPSFNRDFSTCSDSKIQRLKQGKLQNKVLSRGSDPAPGPFPTPTNGSTILVHKKPFISTVKKGEFLAPPPEIASLLGFIPRDEAKVVVYTYSSRPRIVNQRHRARCDASRGSNPKLAKEKTGNDFGPDGNAPYGNIMFDKRVVRGSTFAQGPMPTQQPKWNPYFGYAKLLSQSTGDVQQQRLLEARRRALVRKRAQPRSLRIGSPPPVPGRKHIPVQTEKYLEELFDKPEEADVSCQTDPFQDRPATPLFVPAKTGLDAETQIYPGDLFDFDVEVVPILEVLVGKTLEQSMVEVLEEEELAALRAEQRRFEELRRADLAEQQRLEEQARRLRDEKDRRVEQERDAFRIQQETQERVAAAVLAHGYLADLLPNVLEGMKDSGYLHDVIQTEIEGDFMPWLMDQVKDEMNRMLTSRIVLADMVRMILQKQRETYRALNERETQFDAEVEEEAEEEEEEQEEGEENEEDGEQEEAEEAVEA